MPHQFIGHVTVHHLVGDAPLLTGVDLDAKVLAVVAELNCADAVFVKEFGTVNGHMHYHYWVDTPKSKATVARYLAKTFSLTGVANPGQHVSCKPADSAKLSSYFTYLAKGPHSEHGVQPHVVLDMSKSRMWEELHEAYHKKAEEIRASKKRKGGPGEWYQKLAEECRASGSTTKEDVMQVVTRYYVYESKKGFDKFAVTRTFWAVWSIANGADAHAELLDQCMRMIAP